MTHNFSSSRVSKWKNVGYMPMPFIPTRCASHMSLYFCFAVRLEAEISTAFPSKCWEFGELFGSSWLCFLQRKPEFTTRGIPIISRMVWSLVRRTSDISQLAQQGHSSSFLEKLAVIRRPFLCMHRGVFEVYSNLRATGSPFPHASCRK